MSHWPTMECGHGDGCAVLSSLCISPDVCLAKALSPWLVLRRKPRPEGPKSRSRGQPLAKTSQGLRPSRVCVLPKLHKPPGGGPGLADPGGSLRVTQRALADPWAASLGDSVVGAGSTHVATDGSTHVGQAATGRHSYQKCQLSPWAAAGSPTFLSSASQNCGTYSGFLMPSVTEKQTVRDTALWMHTQALLPRGLT